MENHRIYGDPVSIDMDHVQKFYDQRAALKEQKGWGVVLLGDGDPSIATRVYDYDRDVLCPKLGITAESRVLELGCGMGRWGSILLPHCGAYCGVDFSEEMLKLAETICAAYADKSSFYQLSAPDAVEKEPAFYGGSFQCILLSGVCMYINDQELKRIFQRLPVFAAEHCVICVKKSATLEKRLTLNEFQSEELHSTYDAIYRTREEYNALFQPLMESGFSVREQYFLSEEVGRKRKETNSLCTLLHR